MNRRRVLIKYGGNAMINENLKEKIANQIKALQLEQIQVVLVHGGGPFINQALKEAGIASEFFEGQRRTTNEALHVIEKTLKGEVNASLVNVFNQAGVPAVGLSGKDGSIVLAEKKQLLSQNESSPPVDLGQVGEVKTVHTKLLHLLLNAGYLPVLTCIASDLQGNDYNINADEFAGKIAAALKVDDYLVLTDVDGLYSDYPDPASKIHQLTLSQLPLHHESIITGGMIPKIQSCEVAIGEGVRRAVILNGTQPDQISQYIRKDNMIGTVITK